MLFGFLFFLYTINCSLMVLIILLQQSKGGIGLGAIGGGTQMLFGGSGGQELFQKATWIMGAIFMFGSLGLSILRTKQDSALLVKERAPVQTAPIQLPQEKTS